MTRIQDLLPNLKLGRYPPGPFNWLTDVPGVLVHTQSVILPKTAHHHEVNTGVACILPRRDFIDQGCYASVPPYQYCRSRLAIQQGPERGLCNGFLLPIMSETLDGYLSDIGAMAVTPEHGFKGGTESSNRVIDLRVGGVSAGQLMRDQVPSDARTRREDEGIKDGSIIVVLATDAPLHPLQLQRVAKRAAVGFSRVGGWESNSSGNILLAFSTSPHVPRDPAFSWKPTVGLSVRVMQDVTSNALFEAAADVTEEAIYNALCCAQDMRGPAARFVSALDLHKLKSIVLYAELCM
ncbi:DmpA/ArgJ-like protein [Trichoderma novae-zelandiae]